MAARKATAKATKKKKPKPGPEATPGHRNRFDQLLDDAVLGVKKK